MRIVVSPNAFKGSIGAITASHAIRDGIYRVDPSIQVDLAPVADGGDGLAEILVANLSGRLLRAMVNNPLSLPVDACYGFIEDRKIGIVEMAQASGLALLSEEQYNPETTTTYGTGQLIKRCLDKGAEKILVGLGGSATCDGGIGAAAALGYEFLDKNGKQIHPVGGNLSRIEAIETRKVDTRISSVQFEAVCDVKNPLTGLEGASYVYSPQKGADPEQVKRLDEGLAHLAKVIHKDLGLDIETMEGAGAAGGLGGGVHAFMGGTLRKGIDLVLEIIGMREKIVVADLVITGEGRIDHQTQFDKAPAGVAAMAKKMEVPCIALSGSLGNGLEKLYTMGFDAFFSLCDQPMKHDEAMLNAEILLEKITEQTVRLFLSGKGKTA